MSQSTAASPAITKSDRYCSPPNSHSATSWKPHVCVAPRLATVGPHHDGSLVVAATLSSALIRQTQQCPAHTHSTAAARAPMDLSASQRLIDPRQYGQHGAIERKKGRHRRV